MMPDLIFKIGTSLALLAWACLVMSFVLTCARKQLLLFGGRVVPLLLAGMYLYLLMAFWNDAPLGNYDNLTGLELIFDSHANLAIGWLHFLVFDLIVGRWMIDVVTRENKPKWILIPCLPLTLWWGPIGMLSFFILNSIPTATSKVSASANG